MNGDAHAPPVTFPIPRTVEFAPAAPIDSRITSPSKSQNRFEIPEPVVSAADPSTTAADVFAAVPRRVVNVYVGVAVDDTIPRATILMPRPIDCAPFCSAHR
jgi:hypothetical protein